MAKAEAEIRAQGNEPIGIPVEPEPFDAKLEAVVEEARSEAAADPIDIPLDLPGFDAKLEAAVEQARIFVTDSGGITIPVYANASLVSFERVQAAAQMLADAHPVQIPVDVNAGSIAGTIAKVDALTAATDALGASAGRAYGVWGALGTQIPLFSGMGVAGIMKTVAAWHLLADVAIEFGAVAIPALIATGTFGVAAAGDIGDMYTHFQNILTITDAMRENMAPLTGGLTAMQNAVKPEVYQLAGEAIDTMSNKMGVFRQLAAGTGTVLDQLGARAEVAISSSGMNVFLKNATSDLQVLGTTIGNVFGIFGNLLKSMPGYAQIISNAIEHATGALEDITSSGIAQGAIKTGLAFHGAAIYIGLAATAFGSLARGGLTVAGNLLEKASVAALRFGSAGEAASGSLMGISAAAAEAAALPWAWIGVAAAGAALLAYRFVEAGDAADSFNAKINAAVAAAPLSQTLAVISDGLQMTQSRLGTASLQMHQFSGATLAVGKALAPVAPGLHDVSAAFAKVGDFIDSGLNVPLHALSFGFLNLSTNMGAASRGSAEAAASAVHDYEAYKNEVASLDQQSVTFRSHLAQLGVAFGGTAQAMGILTAAGITSAQMTSKSASSWAQVMAQVQATTVAYQDMGQTGGVLGADMNALDIAASEQATAMSKLNQAWDSTIGIVSGGQSAFITFQQDMLSVNQSFQQTGGTSRTVTETFAAASKAAKAAGATMTGLNAASLQLRSTWQTAYGGASTLIDSLRMMSSVSPGGFPSVTQALKDSIAELMGFGKQAPQTRTELVQLAQELDPAITNFSQLTKWLGNTKDAGKNLNDLVAKMGGNLQDLAADAGSLSASMQSDVSAQFDAARLKASGANTAITNLANAMSKTGATARSIVPQEDAAYEAFRKSGMGAQAAQSMVEAMTGAIFKIPLTHKTKLTADNSQAMSTIQSTQAAIDNMHGKVINITVALGGNPAIGRGVTLTGPHKATGGVIPGYAPGVDSVPAVLSPGEGVLVPEAVRGIGGPSAIHALNRKYGGARVTRGNKTGAFATGGVTSQATFTYPNDQFIINIAMPATEVRTSPYTAGHLSGLTAAQEKAAFAAGKKLADEFAARSLNTVAAIKDYTKQAIAEIDKYYKGHEATRLTSAIESQSKAMQALATKYQTLQTTISAMKTYAANITSNLASSYSDLSNITAPTDALGNPAPVTGTYIAQQLQSKLATLRLFLAAIGKLSKDKLGKTLIAQVIALGPDEGLQYADAILAGGSSLISQLNSIEGSITSTETQIGQEAADIQYGQDISKGFLSGLTADSAKLVTEMHKLGDEIAKELAKDLGVPLKDVKLGLPKAAPKKKEPEKGPIKAPKPAATVNVTFTGTQYPSPVQVANLKQELALALATAP